MPSATVTSKGQITIPKAVREALRLKAGDQVDFLIGQDGRVVLRPGSVDLLELQGLLRRPGRRPVSLKEMERAISRRHARRR